MKREPHGLMGAVVGHRVIAQVNSVEIAENLFRYPIPEEIMTFPSRYGACGNGVFSYMCYKGSQIK